MTEELNFHTMINTGLIAKLAKGADLVNTINGGMSQASMEVRLQDHEWIINLKVPGVDANNLKLEVSGGHICIYQMMRVHLQDQI